MFGFGKRARQDEAAAGVASELRCSFCNKSQRFVRKLIAGPNNSNICNECVDICLDIVSAEPNHEAPSAAPGPALSATFPCSLCHTPTAAPESLAVRERGALCRGCVGEIEAALAERALS